MTRLGLLGCFAGLLAAQTADIIRTTAEEVLVDVVVRDKRGRLVRGLRPSDFEIREDGEVQPATGFREVAGREPSPAPAGALTVDPQRTFRLVSLVFERLGVDGRRLSRTAALDLLNEESGPNVYFAVFAIQHRLAVLQPFTNDRARLKAAIERATSGAAPDFANDLNSLRAALGGTAGSEGAAESTAASVGSRGPSRAVDSGALANEQMAAMLTNMLQFSELASRAQQGQSSIFPLLAIVNEQHRFPGRKTVLYFSEGLQVPNDLVEHFHSTISAANRANVSVYAVDARGLTSAGPNALGEEMLAGASAANYRQWKAAAENSDQARKVSREQAMSLDRAADSIRANAQNTLAELAESTGGFLIANSNDLRAPLRRVVEDANSFYELAYKPRNQTYDGRFRSISVSVARPEIKVQARSGYFALPPGQRQIVLPYEAALLNAIARTPLPAGIDYHAGAIRFRPGEVVLVFEVPLASITFAKDETGANYRTHVSVLALLKNPQGQVVEKISRDVPVLTPRDKLEEFRQGHFIVTRSVRLAPGRYTLETAVLDREGGRTGAKRSVLVAGGRPGELALSGLALVRRLEPLQRAPDPQDPLEFAGGKVTPTLAGAIRGGRDTMLSVYFVVYPKPGAPEKPRLTLEILDQGKVVARGTPELPAPAAEGAIPYFANSPLAGLKPGQYEFRATVQQGASAAQAQLSVTIE